MAEQKNHLYGIVDMGSNGIRFSISDLSHETARSLPTVFQSRTGISLYDAQYTTGVRCAIPQSVIDSILVSLRRFKITCADFGVEESRIKVLATEATRTAVNSEDFRRQIKDATGWEVEMLAKEMEGSMGAMGVASSFQEVEGLVMDLGGGSTQITWMISKHGQVQTSPHGSFSFPYGAAALTLKLAQLESQPLSAKEALASEMKSAFQTAYRDLDIPLSLLSKAENEGGLTLHLSGGGFRGWGYLLMSQSSISPYPIPIINGFCVSKEAFQAPLTDILQHTSTTTTSSNQIQSQAETHSTIFRISKRRASQIPAVAFLINVLCHAIPSINSIRFCQGGVREGYLFSLLSPLLRATHPLISASTPHAAPLSHGIANLLHDALPTNQAPPLWRLSIPSFLSPNPQGHPAPLLQALAHLMYLHASHPKESAPVSALHTPLTGVLGGSVHGISHADRAALALMLCARWGGELAPPHDSLLDRLRRLLGSEQSWWCGYVGSVAALVGAVFPAGRMQDGRERVGLRAEWVRSGLGKAGVEGGIRLSVVVREGDVMTDLGGGGLLRDALEAVEGVGKKKNWVDGFGVRVRVEVSTGL